MNTQPRFTDHLGRPIKPVRAWRTTRSFRIVMTALIVAAPIGLVGAATQVDLVTQVKNLLPGANGGLNANANGFTGVLREASGTASASELSGDATTSGSNAVTVARVNGTSVPTNSSADQALITNGAATGVWASIPNCSGALNYSTSTHTFSCGAALSGSFADAEVPSGTINGSNVTFTLAHTPNPAASLSLYMNGVEQRAGGADYTLATATITYAVAPATGATLIAYYRY